jgi:hypothetical protein
MDVKYDDNLIKIYRVKINKSVPEIEWHEARIKNNISDMSLCTLFNFLWYHILKMARNLIAKVLQKVPRRKIKSLVKEEPSSKQPEPIEWIR